MSLVHTSFASGKHTVIRHFCRNSNRDLKISYLRHNYVSLNITPHVQMMNNFLGVHTADLNLNTFIWSILALIIQSTLNQQFNELERVIHAFHFIVDVTYRSHSDMVAHHRLPLGLDPSKLIC